MACGKETNFISASEARTCGRNNSVIFKEICGIQEAILAAVDDKKLEVIVADSTPMTSINEVQSVVVTNSGAGYSIAEATVTIDHPTGFGANLEPVISGGVITGFTIIDGGANYSPIIANADTSFVGDGNAELQLIIENGMIVQVNIIAPGTGYAVGESIPISHPFGTNGEIEVAAIGTSGEIVAINIVNPGSDYDTVVAEIIIDHPSGQNFSGIVEQSGGIVTGITITNGGIGYGPISPTAVVIDSSGSGAILSVNLAGGQVSSIDIVEGGFNYSDSATVLIEDSPGGTGSGATAEAIVDSEEYSSFDYYQVFNDEVSSREIEDQINQVVEYFQKLGYNIQLEVNPDTSNTIQWHIYW